jgi:salicylate hydroxylase
MARTLKVAVIGGGIGGLTVASAMMARGITVELYEQTDELTPVGAGIQLTPNAVKVLRALGLESDLRVTGFFPLATVGHDWRSGKVVFRTPLAGDCERLYGAPYVQIHRADLQRILCERLPPATVRLAKRCVAVRSERGSAIASFADGSEVEADLLVAADGIRSVARTTLFTEGAPRFTGNICWRSVIPFDQPDYELVEPNNAIWFGPRGHVVTYYVRGGKSVNLVACLETETWTEESWNARSTTAELRAAYTGWHPRLQRLFDGAHEVFKWGLFDREPMPTWTIRRVTLLGDAAHPMLPYLSQGAAMAMEDGLVLARMVVESPEDIARALRRYEAIRVPRTARVQLTSRAQGQKNHLISPWARLRRDLAYRLRNLIDPQSTGLKAGWVYEYDAASVEVERATVAAE